VTGQPCLLWNVQAELGEGPAWFADEGALYFVDIKGGRVHRYDPVTGASQSFETGGRPSFVLTEASGGVLVGSGDSIHRLHEQRLGAVIASVPQPHHNRTNDATVDTQGRLWFGTMDDAERDATGKVWCLDRGSLHDLGQAAVVTNGPAVSSDCQTLFHSDSANRTVWRHRLVPGPRLVESQVFVRLKADEGYPDGLVLDSEDCLWVALWDGWGVRRYSSAGELLLHIRFPCARVTKVAFGGGDLRTALVTTARAGLSQAEIADQPLAGGLFAFEAPAAGRRLPAVKLG
jgi:D-xylonolactonase